MKLISGMSWAATAFFTRISASTLKRRWALWVDARVLDNINREALQAYDRVVGLDVSSVLLDGSQQKAPRAGVCAGRSPVDRGKSGYKWSLATDVCGVPIGFVTATGNVPDYQLTKATLRVVDDGQLLIPGAKLRCDRGYDYPVVFEIMAEYQLQDRVRRRRRRGDPCGQVDKLGQRWPVERANAWLCSFGQLRRNTDRVLERRDSWLHLGIALILVVKIITQKLWQPAY